ncbi:DNA polymerase III subunit beta [Kordiimonas sp. SCSIO 12603]|uniref:DNA polymerase III subunit beta n=1 Tax=Kordiimonas sp. SCSIO 12603 TaxID=2829596 RepID=UPI002107A3DA|nr:DNA polymerase III subunit beta [Kordiimonas sp. SCSIO 12603]UTW58726.1 DNA polymerase III subunit beta [Kordiimonas sp. SCSIO 12603]
MKVTIERNSLLKTLGHVQSVVERRNTIPILSNVMIEASGDTVAMTATDLDIAIIENTNAMVITAGSTTVPAHTLFDIVRKLPDGSEVELTLEENDRLVVKAGRSRFTLACLDKEDFPVMNEGDMPHRFEIASEELKRLIDKARFAISTEETRYYLNGIYLHVATTEDGPRLRAVATDGHRLAQVEQDVPEGASGMPGIIIPRKTVAEVRKLIDETEGAISVALSDTKIRFAFEGVTITSKLIDGTFPDYSRVIPEGNDKQLEMDCRIFAEATDRVSTISSDKTRSVKLSIAPDNLTLSVNSPDSGTATEELAAAYSADPLEIGFNSRYLLDILAQIEGETVQVYLNDPSAPTVLKDIMDDAVLYVLMPMRV